jgi:CRP-like cAMP-binding protein
MGTEEPTIHLCRFILSLFHKNNSRTSFPCGMTQQEVANLLGIHRVTLARAIAELKQLGVIAQFTRKEVHISNVVLLTHMAN